MRFCTSIHCIDGRIQEPIARHLQSRHGFTYVDAITEPGVCKIIGDKQDRSVLRRLRKKIDLSKDAHGSDTICTSGHFDCAANPVDKSVQIEQLFRCKVWLEKYFPYQSVILMYVNEDLTIDEL